MVSPGTSSSKIDFVIITALGEELDAVLAKLPDHKILPPQEDDVRTYYQATIATTLSENTSGAYRVIVMGLLGMGRVQATAAAGDAIRKWKPRNIILVGIAGGIASSKVNIGDILISDQVVDFELQKLTPDKEEIRFEVYRADPGLLDACKHRLDKNWHQSIGIDRPDLGAPTIHYGPIASGDKVIAVGDALMKYRDAWPKLIGVEMEGAGVSIAAFQSTRKPGFLMIRAVSDLADGDKNSARVANWRPYACNAAAAFAIELLKNGPIPIHGKNALRMAILIILLILLIAAAFKIGDPAWRVSVATRIAPVSIGVPITPSLTPTLNSTEISTPLPCLCQFESDDKTAQCIISAEAQAANEGNLALIKRVFAQDATMLDGADKGKKLENPLDHYLASFDALQFSGAVHFDIKQVKRSEDILYYTSGSSGIYTEKDLVQKTYQNWTPSEHWVFQKNDRGCWVVTRFEYNASYIPFP